MAKLITFSIWVLCFITQHVFVFVLSIYPFLVTNYLVLCDVVVIPNKKSKNESKNERKEGSKERKDIKLRKKEIKKQRKKDRNKKVRKTEEKKTKRKQGRH